MTARSLAGIDSIIFLSMVLSSSIFLQAATIAALKSALVLGSSLFTLCLRIPQIYKHRIISELLMTQRVDYFDLDKWTEICECNQCNQIPAQLAKCRSTLRPVGRVESSQQIQNRQQGHFLCDVCWRGHPAKWHPRPGTLPPQPGQPWS